MPVGWGLGERERKTHMLWGIKGEGKVGFGVEPKEPPGLYRSALWLIGG